ncbi:hypothetical protein GE09DRAFT_1055296 [Coniochaeta sp. 2T2.1]|nr:hypothetical protein GE09DRAFT_1055296 [Coniochaeta sp. 2T2.1]
MNNYSEEDDSTPPPRPLLLIISHARVNPLRKPPPDLKFDIRAVHNPPKQIRDKYTGLDRRLREHMLSHGDFVSLLDRAEADIRSLIKTMTDGDPSGGIPPLKEWKPPRPTPSWARRKRGEESGEDGAGEEGEDEDDDDDWDEDEIDLGEDVEERPVIKVGVFCVRGRHRSVAFAEELSGRTWPKGWEVRVVHRDLGKGRKESNRGAGRRFGRRDSTGRGFLEEEDD